MFGFFIGALTVFGVIAVLKHRFSHRNGYGWHGHHHHHGAGPGFSRRGPWGRMGGRVYSTAMMTMAMHTAHENR